MARTHARATTAQTQTWTRGEEMVLTRTRQTDIRLLGFLCWRPGSDACAPSNNVVCEAIGGQPGGTGRWRGDTRVPVVAEGARGEGARAQGAERSHRHRARQGLSCCVRHEVARSSPPPPGLCPARC